MVAPARLTDGVVVVDGNDGADRSGRVAGRDGAGVRHGAVAATKIPTPLSPTVMTPEAALSIVLFTPAKMPVVDWPGAERAAVGHRIEVVDADVCRRRRR